MNKPSNNFNYYNCYYFRILVLFFVHLCCLNESFILFVKCDEFTNIKNKNLILNDDDHFDLTQNLNTIASSSPSSLSAVKNKEFWDQLYQNSILYSKIKYNSLSGDKVCFTCPIDRTTFSNLYHEALISSSSSSNHNDNDNNVKSSNLNEIPPRVTISWATQLNENRIVFFCRNNSRMANNPFHFSHSSLINNNNNNNKRLTIHELNDIDNDAHIASSDSSSTSTTSNDDINDLEYSCESNKLCLLNVKNTYPQTYQCFVKSYILSVKLNVIGKF